jgi:hypothetical protein
MPSDRQRLGGPGRQPPDSSIRIFRHVTCVEAIVATAAAIPPPKEAPDEVRAFEAELGRGHRSAKPLSGEINWYDRRGGANQRAFKFFASSSSSRRV